MFYQVNNLFLHQSYLKSPLPVKLTWKKYKKSFFIIEKILKYRKCPALANDRARYYDTMQRQSFVDPVAFFLSVRDCVYRDTDTAVALFLAVKPADLASSASSV